MTIPFKRSALAAAAMFFHVASCTTEALSVGHKTYVGYKDQFSEGTWVNDLTDCVLGDKRVSLRAHDDEPGFIRAVVSKVCPTPKLFG